jgi:adenylosuccinate synthase
LRAFHTRHGAGPFPTEDAELSQMLVDSNNGSSGWQGNFRVGWFDFVLARYALEVCGGADALCVTHLDWLSAMSHHQVCTAYCVPQEEGGGMIDRLKVNPVLTDLSHQERLTAQFRHLVPHYAPSVADSDAFLRMLEQTLYLPVEIASFGPSAGDKRRLRPVRAAA